MMQRTLLLLVFLLAGCGLRPIYGGGATGVVAQGLSGIAIDPIPERVGQLVRNDLETQFRPGGTTTHRLIVKLEESLEEFGIRGDESVTRERIGLRATYQLIEVRTGRVVLQELARSDVGVDVVRSEYAVVAAEKTAVERNAQQIARQIGARVALFWRTGS